MVEDGRKTYFTTQKYMQYQGITDLIIINIFHELDESMVTKSLDSIREMLNDDMVKEF